jgi:hypothetical protein
MRFFFLPWLFSLGSTGLLNHLNHAFQIHHFHDVLNIDGKMAEYSQEMHNSRRDFHW